MARLTPETVKAMAKDLYGYEMSDEAAVAAARTADAMMTNQRRLGDVDLGGVQPPFSYPVLLAEAERIRKPG